MTPGPLGSLFNLQTHTLIYVCVLCVHRDEWKLMRDYLCSKGTLVLNAQCCDKRVVGGQSISKGNSSCIKPCVSVYSDYEKCASYCTQSAPRLMLVKQFLKNRTCSLSLPWYRGFFRLPLFTSIYINITSILYFFNEMT